jgi:hypothetical protein
MRALFFMTLITCVPFTNGCIDPYKNWVDLDECNQHQCQNIELAVDLAYQLEPMAEMLFQDEWGNTSFTIEEALQALDYVPFSCGQPYSNRISEEVLTDAYPGEIMINEDLFQGVQEEHQATCALAASMVHAGSHLLLPDLKHRCEVEVYCCEACPVDKTKDDQILAAERAMYLTCLNIEA